MISHKPFKVLDAPDIADNFYLNLLDWSSKGPLSIIIQNAIYFHDQRTEETVQFCRMEEEDDHFTSLKFSRGGNLLSLGTWNGNTLIWDIQRETMVQVLSEN